MKALLVEELRAIERSLADVHGRIEQLSALKEQTPWGSVYEITWLIFGFTDDALVDLKCQLREILELRSTAHGGLPAEEIELLEAVGGTF